MIFYPLLLSNRGFFGGEAKLKIFNAENLLAMDSSMFSKQATTSDPYVSIVCPEGEGFRGKSLGKTKVVKKNLR